MFRRSQIDLTEFDALINGLNIIGSEDDVVIDPSQVEISSDQYTEFAPGVFGRLIESVFDDRYEHELVGRKTLQSIPESHRGVLMWCIFEAGSEMVLQAHPQKERAYIIFGIFEDIHNNRKASAGEMMEFQRMEKHRPRCPVETLLLLHFI